MKTPPRKAKGWCAQCGRPYSARACGPTHALMHHEEAQPMKKRVKDAVSRYSGRESRSFWLRLRRADDRRGNCDAYAIGLCLQDLENVEHYLLRRLAEILEPKRKGKVKK